ncbi:MAG: RNA polymerase sigma factor [Steroidobacteraceae bacterium]
MSFVLDDGDDMQQAERVQRAAFERFFIAVERKAFRIAQLELRDEDDALDAVQDSMLQLVRAYSARPEPEWKPLFYRILQNRVRDLQRRRRTRGRIFAWLPTRRHDADEPDPDPASVAESPLPGPHARAEMGESMAILGEILEQLPDRQRQAFLLRNFEGLDVAETAVAMGCTEGTVKTHYFRAVHTLRAALDPEAAR